ncbi:MAG TPA: hypothetical protein VEB60_00480, partial [Candidatus Paceibacterota bacterium]|nr:hypothetical protein [Candidatus Paceibacterota bacterium]
IFSHERTMQCFRYVLEGYGPKDFACPARNPRILNCDTLVYAADPVRGLLVPRPSLYQPDFLLIG